MSAPILPRQPQRSLALLAIAALTSIGGCGAFVAPAGGRATSVHALSHALSMNAHDHDGELGSRERVEQSRRSILSTLFTASAAAGAAVLLPSEAMAEAETMERGGVPLTPFNSLAFNYRGGGSPTLDASAINEASIPYAEFLDKLNADQVTFVEFLAPNGDAAYATLKSEKGDSKPIRIGEGYPIEDPEGWSSPAFVIKAVAKKGVPYKFVVPGLGDSFKM